MKRLELKFGSIKEMLTEEQMKQICGGEVMIFTSTKKCDKIVK